jgi:hypothetical protein
MQNKLNSFFTAKLKVTMELDKAGILKRPTSTMNQSKKVQFPTE